MSLISRLVTKFSVLLILLSSPVYAGVGTITDFRGAGQIKRGKIVAPANRGSSIEKMDTVSTNSQGRFRITFNDATTVNITENSRLVIDDFVYDGNNKAKGKLGLKVALGTVRYASGNVAHGNPRGVNIRTPTATIAVRGTDFVMSVDEAGRSTVVLVPLCFDEKDITKINFDCPTGAIDVMTAAGVVSLTQPFQATMVENSFAPPATPVTINPALKSMNNNIQVAPLETDDGQSLIDLARESLKKFTNPSKAAADDNKEPSVGATTEQVAVVIRPRQATPEELIRVFNEINGENPKVTIYTNVSPTFRKLVQVGWVYARISEDKNQAVGIWTDKDSQTQVISVQNNIIDVYNFMDHKWTTSGAGRPQGNITIIQNGAPPR